VDPARIETNIIYFDTPKRDAEAVVRSLEKQGILSFAAGPERIRFVTHLDVSTADAREIARIIQGLKP
jgi:threonine aldolase